MGVFGTQLGQSVAGLSPAQQQAQRARRAADEKPSERKARRLDDEVDLAAEGVQSADAVRKSSGNGEQESHQDREEHGSYTPQGIADPNAKRRPSLDVEG